jgi:hypothetical protein
MADDSWLKPMDDRIAYLRETTARIREDIARIRKPFTRKTMSKHPTDWRALCAELVDELDEIEAWVAFSNVGEIELAHALIDRARAALARPEPQQEAE